MYFDEPEDDLLLIYYTGVKDIDDDKIFEGDIVKRVPTGRLIGIRLPDAL